MKKIKNMAILCFLTWLYDQPSLARTTPFSNKFFVVPKVFEPLKFDYTLLWKNNMNKYWIMLYLSTYKVCSWVHNFCHSINRFSVHPSICQLLHQRFALNFSECSFREVALARDNVSLAHLLGCYVIV